MHSTSLIKVYIGVSLAADYICIYAWPHMDFTWILVLHVEFTWTEHSHKHSITGIHEKFCDLTISDPQQLSYIPELAV